MRKKPYLRRGHAGNGGPGRAAYVSVLAGMILLGSLMLPARPALAENSLGQQTGRTDEEDPPALPEKLAVYEVLESVAQTQGAEHQEETEEELSLLTDGGQSAEKAEEEISEDIQESATEAEDFPEETLGRKEEDADETPRAGQVRTALADRPAFTDGGHMLLPGWELIQAGALQRPAHTLSLLGVFLERILSEYDGKWSAAVRDLTTSERIVINDGPMPSASVLKLFIMGCVYDDFRSGRTERTDEIFSRMKGMISASSNTDANEIIRILGKGDYAAGIAHINEYITKSGYSENTVAYNPFQEASLVLDHHHTNQTSADDAAEILERIYRRSFGNRRACNEAEQMLLDSTTRYKLPSALPETALAGNKTGETDEIENDAAIVYTPGGDYILTVFSTLWADKKLAQQEFKAVSAEVYRYFSGEDYAKRYYPYLPEMKSVPEADGDVNGGEKLEALGETVEG